MTTNRLPPLNALRAFEAAARRMSFQKAAEELFVTPAALSYQIKQLEEHLGLRLFRRLNRAVELTEEGAALLPGVADGFDAFRRGLRDLERLQDTTGLTVTAGPAFTAKWLAPRFFRFAEDHPDIELRFVASLRMMDFDRDHVDAAIRFGSGEDPGHYSETLGEEWVTPVATPAIAETLRQQGRVAGQTLIIDESLDFVTPRPDWSAWARLMGHGGDWTHGIHFSNADHAIDAALEGAGVVLGRAVLVSRYLETGRLVAPFRDAMRISGQFRFVCPQGAETNGLAGVFLDWLRREMAKGEALRDGMTFHDAPPSP